MWWFKRTSTEFFHFCFHDDQVKAKVGAWLSWVNSTSRWVVKITTVSRWDEEILKVDVFAIRMGASFFLVVGWIIHPPTRIPGSSNKTDYQKIPLLKMIKNVPGGDDCVLVWLLWLASLRWLALSVDRKISWLVWLVPCVLVLFETLFGKFAAVHQTSPKFVGFGMRTVCHASFG